ncbi:NUDIX domain-containing protein, partial [Spirillospora sp. NPDC029432]|uniref:NUDIX domain-containing protein n=1 Tax=Spirillospora sp. NPDC029432 TaxID=3154599 RepID=UPI0034547F45
MPAFRTDAPPAAALTGSRPRLEFAQKAFIADRGRLLLVRKSPSDPHHPGRWEVPGGRLEVAGDVDLDDHIRREVWEEVGLEIEPGPPFHLWEWFMPDRRDRRSRRGDRARAVRVVAAARLCRPVTREITLENQTPGDHLVDPTWVPLAELAGYDLIPSLRPVMRAFLLMHPEAGPPDLPEPDPPVEPPAEPPVEPPGSRRAGTLEVPLAPPVAEPAPEPLADRLPGALPPGAPAPGCAR